MPPRRKSSHKRIDTQVLGDSKLLIIRADKSDLRNWLQDAIVCPQLNLHHIAHISMIRAKYPFEVTRTDLSGTYMIACIEGEGQVLVDDKWVTLHPGQACLQPPFVFNSLKCRKGKNWKFYGIRYLESRESIPLVAAKSPIINTYEQAPLQLAIEGLYAEVQAAGTASAVNKWVDLMHHYVLQFANPHQYDDRLWKLWLQVEQRLEYKWTLYELAITAHLSEEHLRRLCKKYHGRSPMQQLTFLRIKRAMHLLSSTDDKLETIAKSVGYDTPYSFSNVFQKWIHLRPSECR